MERALTELKNNSMPSGLKAGCASQPSGELSAASRHQITPEIGSCTVIVAIEQLVFGTKQVNIVGKASHGILSGDIKLHVVNRYTHPSVIQSVSKRVVQCLAGSKWAVIDAFTEHERFGLPRQDIPFCLRQSFTGKE